MINKQDVKNKGANIIDTQTPQNELLQMLKKHFPQTIKDNQVNLKSLALALGLNENLANMQGYELTFTGKGLANALYSTPVQKELKFESTQSHKGEDSKNFIIRGDNLDVLKLLKASYNEKIKMIYIDPPYNTKSDNFIYADNFREDYKNILKEVGLLEFDEEKEEWRESGALSFFRNITATRSHSGWLAFMLPRLKLARDLLREDGIIFISIDDNEQANLKILCDEIFGEENFVSCFVWQKKSGGGQAKFFYEGHEYILIYVKNKDLFRGLFKFKEKNHIESDFLRKIHGKYTNNTKLKNIYQKYPKDVIDHRNLMFEELDIFLKEGLITKKKYNEVKNNLDTGVYFLKPYNEKFHLICRYNNDKISLMYSIIQGVWTSDGNNENESIFGENIFKDAKPVNFIKQIIQSITITHATNEGREGEIQLHSLDSPSSQESELILDFFAGSGTTAQAVMELNAENNGNRSFILVQLDEAINESKSKSAYDFCKNTLHSTTPVISDITIERVKRAGEKISTENKDKILDLGFKVYSLCDKPQIITDRKGHLKLEEKSSLTPQDKATNLALQSGKTLDKDLISIVENKLYKCEDSYYVISCDEKVLKVLREAQNEYIFIDGYADITLQDFLNLQSFAKERLNVVY